MGNVSLCVLSGSVMQVGNVSLCVLSGCVMQHFNSSAAQEIKTAVGRTLEDMITRGSFLALMKAKLAGDEPEEPKEEEREGGALHPP